MGLARNKVPCAQDPGGGCTTYEDRVLAEDKQFSIRLRNHGAMSSGIPSLRVTELSTARAMRLCLTRLTTSGSLPVTAKLIIELLLSMRLPDIDPKLYQRTVTCSYNYNSQHNLASS